MGQEINKKMGVFRFIGIWFLPIIFGWKIVKNDSGYTKAGKYLHIFG